MVKEDYTDDMYKEDLKLVNFVINKYFKKYEKLKEDLVSIGLMAAWKARLTFNNAKSKYSTYVCKCIYGCIFDEIVRKQYIFDDVLMSEKILSESENLSLVDILEDNFNFDDIDERIIVDKVLNRYLKKISQPNKRYYITTMTLKGISSKEIAFKVDCTISYVNRVKMEFKNKLKELLKRELIV